MAKNLTIKNRNIRIQIWDTAGQEAFRSITRTYYKNSTCAFIVYDITDKKSFDKVITWLNEVKDMCYKDILICLIGNKCDLEGKRVISFEDGKSLADQNNLLFYETSALNDENIGDIFEEILQNIYNERRKVSSRTIDNNNGNIQINVKDQKYCYFMDDENGENKCNC